MYERTGKLGVVPDWLGERASSLAEILGVNKLDICANALDRSLESTSGYKKLKKRSKRKKHVEVMEREYILNESELAVVDMLAIYIKNMEPKKYERAREIFNEKGIAGYLELKGMELPIEMDIGEIAYRKGKMWVPKEIAHKFESYISLAFLKVSLPNLFMQEDYLLKLIKLGYTCPTIGCILGDIDFRKILEISFIKDITVKSVYNDNGFTWVDMTTFLERDCILLPNGKDVYYLPEDATSSSFLLQMLDKHKDEFLRKDVISCIKYREDTLNIVSEDGIKPVVQEGVAYIGDSRYLSIFSEGATLFYGNPSKPNIIGNLVKM